MLPSAVDWTTCPVGPTAWFSLLTSLLYSPLTTGGSATGSTARCRRPIPHPQGRVQQIYVSGDTPATAQRLLELGVPPGRISGDSCASTTWENASLTGAWIRHHTAASSLPAIVLITDPWQLPRASRAFERQQLTVFPVAAEPALLPAQRNRLALRESAATLLYGLQGRL